MVFDPSHKRNSEKNTVSSSSTFLVFSPFLSFRQSVGTSVFWGSQAAFYMGKNEVRSNKEAEAKLAVFIVEGKNPERK